MTAFDRHERRQWAGRGAAYASGFAALCAPPVEALLDTAMAGVATPESTSVLDVGSGTGTVTRAALERGCRVLAVDPEQSMLAHVPSAARRIVGALPLLPLASGAVDAAVANFVVNHIGDPAAAVREIGRVVKPGGRVALTVWPAPAGVAQAFWGEVFAAAGAVMPDLPRLDADVNFVRTEDGAAELLRRGGLDEVSVTTLRWVHRTDPETWWSAAASGIATPGAVLAHQTPAGRERIRAAYDRAIVAHQDQDGTVALPTSALLAAGVAH